MCPVACGATRKPRARAAFTTATTSRTDAVYATAAGCWSTARFQAAWRAVSQSASPGRASQPSRVPASRSRAVVSSAETLIDGSFTDRSRHRSLGAPIRVTC